MAADKNAQDSESRPKEGVSDDLLEAYIRMHLSPNAVAALEAQLRADARLAARLEALRAEHLALRSLVGASLATAPIQPQEAPVSDGDLAAYLDGALPPEARDRLEKTLAFSPTGLARLVALYRASKDAAEGLHPPLVERFLAGETVEFADAASAATEQDAALPAVQRDEEIPPGALTG